VGGHRDSLPEQGYVLLLFRRQGERRKRLTRNSDRKCPGAVNPCCNPAPATSRSRATPGLGRTASGIPHFRNAEINGCIRAATQLFAPALSEMQHLARRVGSALESLCCRPIDHQD